MERRNTIQRALVLETVRTLKSHATADEIYENVKKLFPAISRTTVYRNLQQLCEMGAIRKREIPGSADCYDHLTSNHYHIRCSVCGKVSDIEMSYLEDLEKTITDAHGYLVSGHSIVFSGKCPACLAKEE